MDIIIDRKRKQRTIEFNEPDPMGLRPENKLNELPISEKEENPVDKWLLQNPPKSLMGKKAYALRDNDVIFGGYIVDVYTSRHLLLKCFKDKQNRPIEFEHIISIERKRANG